MVPRAGSAVRAFSHKNSFWPSTLVWCSRPLALPIFALMFMLEFLDRGFRGALARLAPAIGFPIHRITAKLPVAKPGGRHAGSDLVYSDCAHAAQRSRVIERIRLGAGVHARSGG